MTFYYVTAALSACMLVSTFTAAQGRWTTHLQQAANVAVDRANDIANEAREQSNQFLNEFNRWIDKYKDDIEKYRSLHPVSHSRQISQRVEEIIRENIIKSVRNLVRENIGDIVKTSVSLASPRVESHSSSESRDRDRNRHEHRKNENETEESRCKDSEESEASSQESSNSADRENKQRFNSVVNEIANLVRDLRSENIRRVESKKAIVESHLRRKLDILREILNTTSSTNSDSGDSDESYSPPDNQESNNPESAEIRSKVVEIIKEVVSDVINGTAESHNHSEIHRRIAEKIQEIFGSILTDVKSAKQAFLDAKLEMEEAANRLHPHHSDEDSNEQTQNRPFDFALLAAFRSKLRKMLAKKNEYIQAEILLRQKIREKFREIVLEFLNNPTTTTTEVYEPTTEQIETTPNEDAHSEGDSPSQAEINTPDTTDDEARSDSYTTEQSNAVSNVSYNATDENGLKLAAGFRSKIDGDDDDGNSAVVVVVVMACLVISAAVGVVGLVLWKKYHRQRLYVQIPSKNTVRYG